MANKKKIDLVSLIIFGVLVLTIIMAIVGVCIAWTSTTVKASGVLGGASSSETTTLSELAKANADLVKVTEKGYEGFGGMQAFAYITLVLAGLTAIAFVVSKFVNVKVLKWVVIALSALLVVSAIITIALTYSFCGKFGGDAGVASMKVAPAAGAWLLTIFSVIGGAAGVVGALKK